MPEVFAGLRPRVETALQSVLAVPLQRWRQLVIALLVLWLLLSLSRLTWLLMPQAPAETVTPLTVVGADSGKVEAVDIAGLKQMALFGSVDGEIEAPIATQPEVKPGIEDDAVKTSLNLSLVGLVHSEDPVYSRANIIANGTEDQYAIDEELPVGNGVTLAKVLLDRVILDNNGRYEALFLYDGEDSKPQRQAASRQPATPKRSTRVSKMAKDYRDRVYEDPSSLVDVLRIAPQTEDGQLIGYRVNPGKDEEQFEQLGFQPGDVIVSVNDIPLDDPSQALEVYKIMRTAREASFALMRDGEPVNIEVALGE